MNGKHLYKLATQSNAGLACMDLVICQCESYSAAIVHFGAIGTNGPRPHVVAAAVDPIGAGSAGSSGVVWG